MTTTNPPANCSICNTQKPEDFFRAPDGFVACLECCEEMSKFDYNVMIDEHCQTWKVGD